jgi:hypothetical protein
MNFELVFVAQMPTKTIQHVFSSSGELFTLIHIQSQQQTLERGERETPARNFGRVN